MPILTRDQLEEEFDKGCNTDNISDPPSDRQWIKTFIHTQRLADLEALKEEIENIKLDSILKSDDSTNSRYDTWFLTNGLNRALEIITSHIDKIK